jgi:hypothetical protein
LLSAHTPFSDLEWSFVAQLNTTNAAKLARTVLTPAPCTSRTVMYKRRMSALTCFPGYWCIACVVMLLTYSTTMLLFGPARRSIVQEQHSSFRLAQHVLLIFASDRPPSPLESCSSMKRSRCLLLAGDAVVQHSNLKPFNASGRGRMGTSVYPLRALACVTGSNHLRTYCV